MRKTKKLLGYMCGIDYQFEVDNIDDIFPRIYKSVKELKKFKACWKECGIIELEIKNIKWIAKRKLF